MIDWKNKDVVVTGAAGMIGKELCIMLEELGANVNRFDLRYGDDLSNPEECTNACFNMDYVFHLIGVKGNPRKTQQQPVDYMVPMLQCDTNMISAAQQLGVERFLYTSSIAVENPESDKYPAWAKLTGEKLIEAMRIQYPSEKQESYEENITKYVVVRPANVYGRFDNFDNPDAMVITSLIGQALKNDSIELYGGGESIRDFINAKDVAKGMIKAMEEMPQHPVNLCSGEGVKIFDVAKLIGENLNVNVNITHPTDFVYGDNKRVMTRNWDNPLTISIEDGLKEVCNHVRK